MAVIKTFFIMLAMLVVMVFIAGMDYWTYLMTGVMP